MIEISTKRTLLILTLTYLQTVTGVELTFELSESDRACFHEVVKQGSSVTLEFQVVTGGSYDVDVTIQDPSARLLYRERKSQFDSHTFTAPESGTYTVCFSNDFSSISHKLVYMDLQVDDPSVPGYQEHTTVMTQMETSVQEIREALNSVVDHQTHHRLREAQGKKRAEDLNDRVFWWSLAETLAILFVSISQVFIMKHLFSYKNPRPYARA